MTAFPGISSNSPLASGSQTVDRFSDLSSEEFLKIIFTELQKQDPLAPNDSSKLLEQLSSIRSIQSDIELSGQLKSIVTQNQLASAGGLIGKVISGLDENAVRVMGEVVSVSRTRDGPVLNLKTGERVAFDQVDRMLAAPTPATDTGGGSGTPATPTTGGPSTDAGEPTTGGPSTDEGEPQTGGPSTDGGEEP